ncbi:MAG: LysR family transcriptional regulator [Myxococcota bacterium]
MQDVHLRDLDLNLLVVLDVLLEERSVTRAATRLHRSQSAVSHALARLRSQLDDPLLVRVGAEMRPSPRAAAMMPELNRLLRSLQQVLVSEPRFDPSSTTRLFTLVAPDFLSGVLTALIARLAAEAPRARLEIVPPGRGVSDDVRDGRVDLAVAPARAPSRGDSPICVEHLGTIPWAVFGRAGHPALDTLDLDAWLAYPHIMVRTGSAGPSQIDRLLEERGLARQITVHLPAFTMAPPLLATTDLLLTVPQTVLVPYAEAFGLRRVTPPLPLSPLPLGVHWSRHRGREPAVTWFRGQAVSVLSAVLHRGHDT